MKKLFLSILFLSFINLYASPSEDKLKAVIIGKIAKFITWESKQEKNFVITVLDSKTKNLLDKVYHDKSIKSKKVKIVHIKNINELGFTHILYIAPSHASSLKNILAKIEDKNILTVSDIRGFSEKEGVVQIYFASQKVKLKINLDSAKKSHLKISSSLLRIATVVQKGS